jgi:hypothetical protein
MPTGLSPKQLNRIMYMVLLVVPGGWLALPALAWWLGRRRASARKSAKITALK